MSLELSCHCNCKKKSCKSNVPHYEYCHWRNQLICVSSTWNRKSYVERERNENNEEDSLKFIVRQSCSSCGWIFFLRSADSHVNYRTARRQCTATTRFGLWWRVRPYSCFFVSESEIFSCLYSCRGFLKYIAHMCKTFQTNLYPDTIINNVYFFYTNFYQ